MSDEPTGIPRSGSQYRGKSATTPTDKMLDDALGKGEKTLGIIKKLLAYTGSSGTGGLITQIAGNVLNMPDMKWWMGVCAALGLHVAVMLGDFAAKALRRINTVATKAETIGTKVEHALKQLAAIVKRMDAGQAGHESLGRRVSVLEAEAAARREEAEREDLNARAARLGVQLDADMTIEELRLAVKRATSKGKLPSFRRKPGTDETAVPPPTVDFEPLDPEAP